MLLIAIVLLPALAAVAAYTVTDRGRRSWLLIAAAAAHLALVAALWQSPDQSVFGGWIAADALFGPSGCCPPVEWQVQQSASPCRRVSTSDSQAWAWAVVRHCVASAAWQPAQAASPTKGPV